MRRWWLLLVPALAWAGSYAQADADNLGRGPGVVASAVAGETAVYRQILVTFVGGADAAVIADRIAGDHGLHVVAAWDMASMNAPSAVFALPQGRNRLAVIARLRDDLRIASAQRVFVHRVAGASPNDPYFSLQRRTRRGGIESLVEGSTGRDVRIAVIDTGVDRSHPDLEGQIATARNFVGGDVDAIPAEFHGTAVAGLIVARAGNGIGIHGLAPQAQIIALRACWEPAYGKGLCSTQTLAQALDFAIMSEARIINLSLAGPDDPILAQLVQRAVDSGAVVFGAVGLDEAHRFPATNPNVIAISVGAADDFQASDRRIAVPGGEFLTTVPEGRYDFVTGASYATAHASGLCALMLQQKPDLDSDAIVHWFATLRGPAQP